MGREEKGKRGKICVKNFFIQPYKNANFIIFFCNVRFYCSHYHWSTDFFITFHRISASNVSKQMLFDSSHRFPSMINFPPPPFISIQTFLCAFFQFFFIADNFDVQQKEPYFDSNQNSNITVLENESVVLKCVVRNKGNKTVSQNYFWYLKLSFIFIPERLFSLENLIFGGFSSLFFSLSPSLTPSVVWCFLIKNHGMNNNELEGGMGKVNEFTMAHTHSVFRIHFVYIWYTL